MDGGVCVLLEKEESNHPLRQYFPANNEMASTRLDHKSPHPKSGHDSILPHPKSITSAPLLGRSAPLHLPA